MSSQPTDPMILPLWQALLLLAPAAAAALAAALAGPRRDAATAWRIARLAATAGLGLALLSLVAVLAGSQGQAFGQRADLLGAAVQTLVAFIGWVIVRYSQPYLNGEHGESGYVRWLMATLAAVGVVVVSNHLLVLALAWMGTSLALHRLLTFFGERPAAVVAAHKKFIVGRAADLCMLGATALFALAFGTLHIDQIVARAAAAPLPVIAQAAVVLIALAALLKCAQLPFHGWLIQVMEAPTPVSALLHAGIVNLGGFVLMRFAPLVSEVGMAQWLLVLVGGITAVLAALVMSTRISIKVSLAWSTCAQMGFMLMQCGLGAWEMAALHLLAHSLYKAHAFLAAGGAVRRAQLRQLAPVAAAPSAAELAVGMLLGLGMTLAAGAAVGALGPAPQAQPVIWVLAAIVALALVPLLRGQALAGGGGGSRWVVATLAGSFAVAAAYFVLHALLAGRLGGHEAAAPTLLVALVALLFAALFIVQSAVAVAPQGALARRLYPWFYGGLFLDEAFTRRAFARWPPPAPRAAGHAPLITPPFNVTATGARP